MVTSQKRGPAKRDLIDFRVENANLKKSLKIYFSQALVPFGGTSQSFFFRLSLDSPALILHTMRLIKSTMILWLFSAACFGQTDVATVLGTITDPSGAVVPQAKLRPLGTDSHG